MGSYRAGPRPQPCTPQGCASAWPQVLVGRRVCLGEDPSTRQLSADKEQIHQEVRSPEPEASGMAAAGEKGPTLGAPVLVLVESACRAQPPLGRGLMCLSSVMMR